MLLEKLVVGQLQTNCYLLGDEKTLATAIIDPGDDADYILRRIRDLQLKPKFILATHGHFDHLLAVTELRLSLKIPFLLAKEDLFLLDRLEPTTKYFLGNQTELDPVSKPDEFLSEEKPIKLGQQKLKIIKTPGHTPGGVSFYTPGMVFSGDIIFAHDGIGRTDFEYASAHQLKKSIKKLLFLPTGTVVYPGHGDNFLL